MGTAVQRRPQKGRNSMTESIVYIDCRLTKDGAKDVVLTVQRDSFGRPSPCLVTEDGRSSMIGGADIESVEQIFQYQVAQYPGYAVRDVRTLLPLGRIG
jgi:hypothetical protein